MRVFDAPGDYLHKFESLNGNYDYLMTSYFNDAYGQANFVGQNMSEQGYPTIEIIPNYRKAQYMWIKEHISRSVNALNWKTEILFEQIAHYKPEILMFVGWSYGGILIKELKRKFNFIKKIIFWTGESLPETDFMTHYDAVFSCDKGNVLKLNNNDKASFHINHAFNFSLNKQLLDNDKNNTISFCGSIKFGASEHSYRAHILSHLSEKFSVSMNGNVYVPSLYSKSLRGILAKSFHNILDIIDKSKIPMNYIMTDAYKANISLRTNYKIFKELNKKFEPPIYGLEYLQKIKDSGIVLNTHSNTSFACNMRLFEGSGVGSCLVSDYKKNLHEIFEIDTEIICYDSKDELVEKVDYLINNPEKAREIGKKAMLKTKQMHTYKNRIEEYINAINHILKK